VVAVGKILEAIGVKTKHKIGSVGNDNQKSNLNEEYERFEFKGGIC